MAKGGFRGGMGGGNMMKQAQKMQEEFMKMRPVFYTHLTLPTTPEV